MNERVDSQRGSEITKGLKPYPSRGGLYWDICADSHGGVLLKVLRCQPTDASYIKHVASMCENKLRPMCSKMSHDNIVPYKAIRTDNSSLPRIELPICKKGSIVDQEGSTSATKLAQIKQVAAGLSYLHAKGITHGNICSNNMLIRDDDVACISDPALDILMRRLRYGAYKPIPATWCYKPPEELRDGTVGHKADVYSWTSVVYEVFCGQQPYHGYHYGRGIVTIIENGHRTLDRPPTINHELWKIMQKCWRLNPNDRPTMLQVESELHELRTV